MKQEMYVIAARGRGNVEVYLAVDESIKCKDPFKVFFKWTENINEALATFTISDLEDTAKCHFKNYNKWYIKPINATFE